MHLTRNRTTCTVETVCCFLPQCGQLKKHGKNQIKSKKTCFFLFLFCLLPAGQWEKFLTVFLICTFVQNYNRTGRNRIVWHGWLSLKGWWDYRQGVERSGTPDYWCDVILRTQNGWQNKSHVCAFILSLLRSSEKQNRTLYRGSATLHTLSVFYQPFGLSLQYAFLILFHVSQTLDSLRTNSR